MPGTFTTRKRTSFAAATLLMALIFSERASATSLAAATQAPAVLADQSVSVPLTTHATIPSGQSARILSLSTSGTHGTVTELNDTTVTYAIGRRLGTITVTTMISWRGEWYVVHLIGFDS